MAQPVALHRNEGSGSAGIPVATRTAIRYDTRLVRVTTGSTPIPGAGEVLVRIEACGVCASDLPEWLTPATDGVRGFGHEPVGVVVDVGPGATRLRPGDRVTGRFGPAFADYGVAVADHLVAVPDELGLEAVLGEPLGCIVEAERRTATRWGDRVAIVGLGFMGLGYLQLVRQRGAGRIVAIDPRPDARAKALELGADEALAPGEVSPDYRSLDMASWDHAGAFEVVVEASGTQDGLTLAGELVRGHGTLSILGYHQGLERTVDVEMWNWKALDIVNAHVRRPPLLAEATRIGLAMMASGRLDAGSLITHRVGLGGINDAFRLIEEKPPGFIKAIVVMGDETTSEGMP